MAANERAGSITENPLAGGRLSTWLGLLLAGGRVEWRYVPRACFITFMTTLMLPFRLLQRLVFGRRIAATTFSVPPLFVLGHYRSGTTYLQNLLIQDPRLGFVSTTQAVVPEAFLLGAPIRRILALFLSETRPMDNVEQSPELPEEPEHAVGNLARCCFYHGLTFPDQLMDYFRRWVLFAGASAQEVSHWQQTYLSVLKAATFACGGRRLMIKNPPDMARLPQVLELFPDAKFVHIVRDPYVMFASLRNFYRTNLRDWQLHGHDPEALEESIFTIYSQMMSAYACHRDSIPSGNLVEVRFEDLEEDPVGEIQRLYAQLGLEDFESVRAAVSAYAAAKRDYRKNRYQLTGEEIARIAERWQEQIERWSYPPPEPNG